MKPTSKELIAQLSKPGWEMDTGSNEWTIKNRTLEDIANVAHARSKKGEAIGPIRNIETAAEIGLMELELLWEHLGLPK